MAQPASSPPLRIVVADGDPQVVALVRRMLGEPYELRTATDATELNAAVAGAGFDLVLLDMDLPGTDTASAVMLIGRANPRARVLLVAGSPDHSSIERCRALGVEGPILKPFSTDGLIAAVRRVYRSSEAPPALRLLLVEDDPSQLAEVRGGLTQLGYKVTAAECAEAALNWLGIARFDAILTDNILPGLTALQVMPRLSASGCPVVVMTSRFDQEIERDALLLGAAACLSKPLDARAADRAIRRARAAAPR